MQAFNYGVPIVPVAPQRKRNMVPTVIFAIAGIYVLFRCVEYFVYFGSHSWFNTPILWCCAGVGCLLACWSGSTSKMNRWTAWMLSFAACFEIIFSYSIWHALPSLLVIPFVLVLYPPIESPKYAKFRPFQMVMEGHSMMPSGQMSPLPVHTYGATPYQPSPQGHFGHSTPTMQPQFGHTTVPMQPQPGYTTSPMQPQPGFPTPPPPQYQSGSSTFQPDFKR